MGPNDPITNTPFRLFDEKRDEMIALCQHFGVKRLRVFGSALRADWHEITSDIDFLAEFGPAPEGINLFDQQFGFQVELEKLFGMPVDVVDWAAVKKPIFRHVAEGQAQEIYAA